VIKKNENNENAKQGKQNRNEQKRWEGEQKPAAQLLLKMAIPENSIEWILGAISPSTYRISLFFGACHRSSASPAATAIPMDSASPSVSITTHR
jgi:hypothetical protein